jgi:tagatose-1,6-bisphosphate aldolase
MANETNQRIRELVDRLRAEGHYTEAEHLTRHLTQDMGHGVLFALREACETILTAVEAVDPVTQTMIEELRVDIDKWLSPASGHPKGP